MANIIEMPKLSDTMTAGTVVSWLKNEGDVVESGDILAEIETDKATQELETFDDGTILKIYVDFLWSVQCQLGIEQTHVELVFSKMRFFYSS